MTTSLFPTSILSQIQARSADSLFEQKQEPYQHHNFDVLAKVVDLYRQGIQPYQMHEHLTMSDMSHSVSSESSVEADNIRKFFRNKILLRRLKNQFVSQYMSELEQTLDEVNKIRRDRLSILITAPRFYKESVQTEDLFRKYKSIDSDRGLYESNEIWTYVTQIERISKNQKAVNFYFSNSENNLLKVSVPHKDISLGAWTFLAEKKTIGIRSKLIKTRIKGYDYCMYALSSEYEIF